MKYLLTLLLLTLSCNAGQMLNRNAFGIQGTAPISLPGVSQGLVALYHFNSANPLKDEVTSNNGSNVNSVVTNDCMMGGGAIWTPGTSGNGFWTTNSALLHNKPAGTMSFWVKVIGAPSFGSPFVLNNGTLYEIGLIGNNAGTRQLRFITYPNAIVTPDNAYTIASWVHLAWAYNKGTRMEVYTNGVLAVSNAAPPNVNLTMERAFAVGIDPYLTTSTLNLICDELAIYTNALTASQIKSIYAANIAGVEITP